MDPPTPRGSLRAALAAHTRPAELVEPCPRGVRCLACAHRCELAPGQTGRCTVRFYEGTELRVPFGYVARRYVRTIESNAVFHVLPGAKALVLGMYGCDMRCPYCHNWKASQALRESVEGESPDPVDARALVAQAVEEGCAAVCFAYNEPLITAEWVREVFARAHAEGLTTGIVTDGDATPEVLDYLRPVTDFYRVDVKGHTEAQYEELGGHRDAVWRGIEHARSLGYWIELVTLVVPGFNDRQGELREIAHGIAAIDPEIPWHLNAFYPRYRLADRPRTGSTLLVSIAGMAYAAGLRFVYVGNVPHEVPALSHTRCPECRTIIVDRFDFETRRCDLRAGACPRCDHPIPGIWEASRGSLAGRS